MLVGIVLLVRALIKLRTILWGIVLLTLGLLSVSGFFDRPLRDLIHYCKKECGWNKKTVSSTAKPAENEAKKPAKTTAKKK